MEHFQLPGEVLFDIIPFPALLVREDIVLGFNRPAEILFQENEIPLAESAPLHPELAALLRVEDEMELHFGGADYFLHVHALPKGTLVVLEPVTLEPDQLNDGLAAIGWQIDQCLNASALALQEMEPPEDIETRRRMAAVLHSHCRMTRLAQNLQALSRLSRADKAGYMLEVMDLAGLCLQLERELVAVGQIAGFHFTLECPPGNLLVQGSSELLTQMIFHLVSNAVGSIGTEQPQPAVSLVLRRDESRIFMIVSSNGTGMDESEAADALRPALWQPFSPTPKRGLGLGISICERIARFHRGTLVILPGSQAKVVVTLPLAKGSYCPALREHPALRPQKGFAFPSVLIGLADVLPLDCYDPIDLLN